MDNQSLGTIREFETQNFRVVVDAVEDYEVDLDLSFDETGEVRRKLENGTFVSFTARARVFHKATGEELGSDYLGGCIYESLNAFQDHIVCGIQNRKRVKQEGAFQIYRKNHQYDCILQNSDKLKKRGFSSIEKAEQWAKVNAKEDYEIKKSGMCGSYFSSMVSEAIQEARKTVRELQGIKLRAVK